MKMENIFVFSAEVDKSCFRNPQIKATVLGSYKHTATFLIINSRVAHAHIVGRFGYHITKFVNLTMFHATNNNTMYRCNLIPSLAFA